MVSFVGASYETIVRMLKKLEKNGVIKDDIYHNLLDDDILFLMLNLKNLATFGRCMTYMTR